MAVAVGSLKSFTTEHAESTEKSEERGAKREEKTANPGGIQTETPRSQRGFDELIRQPTDQQVKNKRV